MSDRTKHWVVGLIAVAFTGCGSVTAIMDPTVPKVVGAASLAGAEIPLPLSLLAAATVLRPDERAEAAPAFPMPPLNSPPLREMPAGIEIDGIGPPQHTIDAAITAARHDALRRLLLYTGVELNWVADYVHREAGEVTTQISTRTAMVQTGHLQGVTESMRECRTKAGWFQCTIVLTVERETVRHQRSYANARRQSQLRAVTPRSYVASASVSLPLAGQSAVQRNRAERLAKSRVMATIAQQVETHVHVRDDPSASHFAILTSSVTLREVVFTVEHEAREVFVTGVYVQHPAPSAQ